MQIYTYCSYRGSYNGYQYAFFDEREQEEWTESILATEIGKNNLPEEFSEIKGILERENGWKLILKKHKKGAVLLISKLEESISQEGKEFFFINLALVDSLSKLQKIAANYIVNLVDAKEKGCFSQIIACLKPGDSRETYLLNTAKCKELFQDMESARERTPSREYVYHKHLEKSPGKTRRERKKEIKKLMEDMLQFKKFSGKYILVVTNGGSSLEKGNVNIMFDMDYIR